MGARIGGAILVVAAGALLAAASATATEWSGPEVIANQASGDFDQGTRHSQPRVAVDGSGRAWAVWSATREVNGTLTGSVWVSTRPLNGTWSAAEDVSDAMGTYPGAPALDVNAAGDAVVAYGDDNGAWAVTKSRITGSEWSAPVKVSTDAAANVMQIDAGVDDDGFATVAWRAEYGANRTTNPNEVRSYVRTATGKGDTFVAADAVVWTDTTDGWIREPFALAVDTDGSAILVGLHRATVLSGTATSTHIQAVRRDTRSGTWTAPVNVSSPDTPVVGGSQQPTQDKVPDVDFEDNSQAAVAWRRTVSSESGSVRQVSVQARVVPIDAAPSASTQSFAAGRPSNANDLPGNADDPTPDIEANPTGDLVLGWVDAPLVNNVVTPRARAATRPAGGAWSAPTDVSGSRTNRPAVNRVQVPAVAINDAGDAAMEYEVAPTSDDAFRRHMETAVKPVAGAWSSVETVPGEPRSAPQETRPGLATGPTGPLVTVWGTFLNNTDTILAAVRSDFAPPPVPDQDGDGIGDAVDNCPDAKNPDQADNDNDKVGNACDATPNGPDADGDGVPDATDNCKQAKNADQADNDNDKVGNACDSTPDGDPQPPGGSTTTTDTGPAPAPDGDGDGKPDANDNCPAARNADQANADGDAQGDACDPTPNGPDADGDGKPDARDNCVNAKNPDQTDFDRDGIGDACDAQPLLKGEVKVVETERTVLMPKVVGLRLDDAKDRVSQGIGFADFQVVEVHPPKPPKGATVGDVIDQRPKAGASLRTASNDFEAVRLTVYAGSKPTRAKPCPTAAQLKGLKKTDFAVIEELFDTKTCDLNVNLQFNNRFDDPSLASIKPDGKRDLESVFKLSGDPADHDLRLIINGGAGNGLHTQPTLSAKGDLTANRSTDQTLFVRVHDRAGHFLNGVELTVDTTTLGAAADPHPLPTRGLIPRGSDPLCPASINADCPMGRTNFSVRTPNPGMLRIMASWTSANGVTLYGVATIAVVSRPSGSTFTSGSGVTFEVNPRGIQAIKGPRVARLAAESCDDSLWKRLINWVTGVPGCTAGATGSSQAEGATKLTPGPGIAAYCAKPIGSATGPAEPVIDTVISTTGDGKIATGTGKVVPTGQCVMTGNADQAVGLTTENALTIGGNVITAGGANVITAGGANVITAGGANVITAGGANAVFVAPGG